jgi:hypothetical protein
MPGVDDPQDILDAVGFDRGELNMIFHFEMYDSQLKCSKFARINILS